MITFAAFFADTKDEVYHEVSYYLVELQGSLLYIALSYMVALLALVVNFSLVVGALMVVFAMKALLKQ